MNARTVAAGAALLCVGAIFPTTSALADEGSASEAPGNACTVAGNIASKAGLTYVPGEGTYNITGTMDCVDPAYEHATLTGTGTGILGCFGGFQEAVYKLAWSNGETSTITLKSGDFTYGTGFYGQVTKGALAGSHVGAAWGREAAGAEYKCAVDSVKSYQFAGGVGFHYGNH